MKSIFSKIGVFIAPVLALLSGGCIINASAVYMGPPPPDPSDLHISGIVKDSVTAEGIQDIRVMLLDNGTIHSTISDSNGNYTIDITNESGTNFKLWTMDIDGTNNGEYNDYIKDVNLPTNKMTTNIDIDITNQS